MTSPADVARELELLNKEELVDRATAMALALDEAIELEANRPRLGTNYLARWREARRIT